jgi:hypothetical protein
MAVLLTWSVGMTCSLQRTVEAQSSGPPAGAGVLVSGMTSDGRTAYATGTKAGCRQQGCAVLLASADGGATWADRPAAGWSGQPVVGVTRARGNGDLVAAAPGGIEVSTDGGRTFRLVTGPSGQIDVTGPGVAPPKLVVSVDSSQQYVESMPPAGDPEAVTSPSLSDVRLWWNPSFPGDANEPAMLGTGRDPTTGLPTILWCDRRFVCTPGGVIAAASDAARLFVSPHYGDDHLILAATRTAFLRSADGGRTFASVMPISPRVGTVITTVSGVAFSTDFDAVRGTGFAVAAIIAVTEDSNHHGTTYGGVVISRDGASWTRLGQGSALDAGAEAVAVTDTGRVLAAYIQWTAEKPVSGGILCTADLRVWQPSCPAESNSLQGMHSNGLPIGIAAEPPASTSVPTGPSKPGSAAVVGAPRSSSVASRSVSGSSVGAVAAGLTLSLLLLGVAVTWRLRRGQL